MKTFKKVFIGLGLCLLVYLSFSVGNATGKRTAIANENGIPLAKINKIENLIDQYYLFDIDKNKQQEGAVEGYVKALGDPYSEFLTKEEMDSLNQQTEGEYAGVGIVVTPSETGAITVVSAIKGSPAFEKGIKKDDIILKINGKDYNASQMNDAVKVMKGKPNTDVKLTIARMENKTSKIFDVNITRRMISLTTVNSQKIGDIGYINITQFDRKTDKEFIEQYENLKKQNVKSIVLDLRNNPGGLLDSTVKIADYLLPQGVIVKTVDKNKKEDVQKSDSSEQNLPMVVLVNGSSASASEILTGALKDYKKATIVGEKTFGKGIVQTIIPMDKGEGLKLTISEYFSPNGNKIHKQGVKPDVEIKLDEKAKGIGVEFMKEDNQLQKALEILNKK
ncbi:S41 family peptidase [Finegoldia magna]|uniref:S41 family peptidase n=1 Tax=Finegoldia magna TaxID=1260 RepID=A0A943QNH4_FINMA|nr:S41 family peptidase [Finegoldia magna]MBS5359440.1 S41 family peptidase [Finegoldia magna]MBS5964701.1 S41 family peptidase [Finegoldia magna]MBS5970739.1 S41 family peptidase [Finegoldia magna]MCA5587673.1 S41 family peptidase [Finegoldia magna]MDU5199940.1 S41 family peptidase [Finegoldia magna]